MDRDKDFIHKCAICKKKFSTYSAGAGWIYTSKKGPTIHWYCSYSCWVKYKRPLEEKERERATVYE